MTGEYTASYRIKVRMCNVRQVEDAIKDLKPDASHINMSQYTGGHYFYMISRVKRSKLVLQL